MQRSRLIASVGALGVRFALATLMGGCSRSIDVARFQPPYRVYVYERRNDEPERVIVAGAAEADALIEWIEAHETGWSPSLITYVPRRVIRGNEFHLNFINKLCVLNLIRDGRGEGQWVKTIKADDVPDVFGKKP